MIGIVTPKTKTLADRSGLPGGADMKRNHWLVLAGFILFASSAAVSHPDKGY
jgi:hypothetical protein